MYYLSFIINITIGVPQGSVLGPILFIILINDLVYYLEELYSILFADDTTIGSFNVNAEEAITKMGKEIENILNWCKFNKFNINWSKTYGMFITNQKSIVIPLSP